MSSKSNNLSANPLEPYKKTFELVSVVFGGVMIFVALLVILLNLRLSRRVATRRKHQNVKKLRKMLIKARSAVKTGMLSAIETVILALEAGMTLEDVRLEYVASTGTREEILESVFGKLVDKFFHRLKTSGRFMENGYANEKVFAELWRSESYRELVMTQNRAECRTQTFQMPVDVPNSSSHSNAKTDRESKLEEQYRSLSHREPSPIKRQSAVDSKKPGKRPEVRPFICGNNDDAQ